MNRVYFQPVGDNMAKYKRCVNTPIQIEDLKPLLDHETYNKLQKASPDGIVNLWGIADGFENRGKNLWNTMNDGDWVIFTSHRKFWSGAKVAGRMESEAISEKFLKEKGYKNIYFVVDKKNIDETTSQVKKDLNLHTVKINAEEVVRRFDGLGLSKKAEINDVDMVDNQKIIKWLTGYKSKPMIDLGKTSNVEPKKRTTTKKPTTVKKAPVKKVDKPATKVTTINDDDNEIMFNPTDAKKTNFHEEKVIKTEQKEAKKDMAKQDAKIKAETKAVDKRTADLEKKADKKTTPTKAKSSKKPVKKVETKEKPVNTTTTTNIITNDTIINQRTKQQVSSSDRPVLKIRPITNLTSSEQKEVIKNLPTAVKSETTFADKYYVLDNGLVIMVARDKKDIKQIKKYLKR